MRYWLMKTEPDECSIDDALAAPRHITPWTGVRNYQARNFMRDQMRVGDGVLFYHSSCEEPGIAGVAEVASAAYPQPTEYTPVWLMRQAGRYLPEYNATRARAGSFLKLVRTPALATEVTLQPLERFSLDAAILFSDILTLPDAMGLGLAFSEGEGPRFARPLRDEAAVAQLAVPDMDKLRY